MRIAEPRNGTSDVLSKWIRQDPTTYIYDTSHPASAGGGLDEWEHTGWTWTAHGI